MKKSILLSILALFIVQPILAFASYGFTDQEEDLESNLYYFDSREYDPNIGKFLQEDPVLKDGSLNPHFLNNATQAELNQFLSNPQNLNPYSYTRNNPVNYVDPTGNYTQSIYTVKEGDTLSGVFGNQWQDVANYNNLADPSKISVGQQILVPNQLTILDKFLDVSTSIVPGVSDLRDGLESLLGQDAISGRKISEAERLDFAGYSTAPFISASLVKKGEKVGEAIKNLSKVTFKGHGIDQIITRGIKPSEIGQALKAPIKVLQKVDDLGRVSFQYVGRQAVIVLNKLSQVVTGWRLHK